MPELLVTKCTLATVTRSANRPSPPRIVRCTAIRVRPARVFASTSPSSTFSRPTCSQRPPGPLRGPRVRRTAPCRKRLGQRGQRPLLPPCEVDAPNADAGSLNVRSARSAAHGHPGLERRCVGRRVAIVGPPGPWAHDCGLARCPDSGVHHTVHRNSSRRPPLPFTGHAASLRIGAADRLPPTKGSSTRGLHFRRQSRKFHLSDTKCHVSVMFSGYHAGILLSESGQLRTNMNYRRFRSLLTTTGPSLFVRSVAAQVPAVLAGESEFAGAPGSGRRSMGCVCI